jgi:hypothetical protein
MGGQSRGAAMLSQGDGCAAGGVDNRDTVQQETRASVGHVWAGSPMGSTRQCPGC